MTWKKSLAMISIFLLGFCTAYLTLKHKDTKIDSNVDSVEIQPEILPSSAKNFYVKTLSGRTIKIDFDHARKHNEHMVLHFWGTWCRPCLEDMPSFITFANSVKEENVSFAAISWMESGKNEEEKLKRIEGFVESIKGANDAVHFFLGDNSLHTPTAQHYGLGVFPLTVFVDKDGNIVKRISGKTDWQSKDVRSLVDNFLAGNLKPIENVTVFDS